MVVCKIWNREPRSGLRNHGKDGKKSQYRCVFKVIYEATGLALFSGERLLESLSCYFATGEYRQKVKHSSRDTSFLRSIHQSSSFHRAIFQTPRVLYNSKFINQLLCCHTFLGSLQTVTPPRGVRRTCPPPRFQKPAKIVKEN